MKLRLDEYYYIISDEWTNIEAILKNLIKKVDEGKEI